MKKFFTSLFAVMILLGIAGTIGSYKDAMTVFSGKTIDFNSSTLADYDEEAMIEGEIYYVYDYFAVEEVTNTTYGIKTGSTETYFYLVESYDREWFLDEADEYEPVSMIYSTSDKDEIAKLDKMVEDWYTFEDAYYAWEEAFYNGETEEEMPSPPTETFEFKGFVSECPDAKILEFRKDYIVETLGYDEEGADEFIAEYCSDMIIEKGDPAQVKMLFFIAIGVGVAGIIGLIATLVASSVRKKKDEELY